MAASAPPLTALRILIAWDASSLFAAFGLAPLVAGV
jgi:hypothetical protein